MIPYFDILDPFSDGFDDSASFVAEDGGEGAFWVFTGEGVGVAMGSEGRVGGGAGRRGEGECGEIAERGKLVDGLGVEVAGCGCLRVTNPGAVIITHGHKSSRTINETIQIDPLHQLASIVDFKMIRREQSRLTRGSLHGLRVL